MHGRDADLAAFYDQEAAIRLDRPIDPQRILCRTRFIELLAGENRQRVLEVGTGPGRDAVAFMEAGLDVTGIDLSAEHVRMARAAGVDAVQASLFNLPFSPRSFDAGWTMSTLLHVADERFDEAMSAICLTLRDGAPLAIGLWGGLDREFVSDFDEIQPPRFFSLRSNERAEQMLAKHGDVERLDTWNDKRAGTWEYQFAIVRVTAAR